MSRILELPARPGPLLRWFFRLPLVYYRIGLGWVMGRRLLLTTVGRRTGKLHRVVVDIVGHDPRTDTYHVLSGYGKRADWYRNLLVNPNVRVQVGRRAFAAQAVPLSEEESASVFVDYVRQHPHYNRIIFRLVGMTLPSSDEDMRQLGRKMPLVAIRRVADSRSEGR